MDIKEIIDGFGQVLVDADKAGAVLSDPMDRAMIVATLVRLVEAVSELQDQRLKRGLAV